MISHRESRSPGARALLITLIYAAVGTGWILGSDYLATLIAGAAAQLAVVQRIKGLGYVVLTAAGLFVLIRHALESLRQSEKEKRARLRERDELASYLESIIRAAPVAIFDLDESARVKSLWNPAAERMFGYAAAEALDGSVSIVADDEWDRIAPQVRRVQAGEPVEQVELELSRRDGTHFPAVLAAAPLLDLSGKATVVLVSDITDLRNTVAQLEAALGERNILLHEVHHRVKNNLQIISSLLMMESHRAELSAGEGREPDGLGRATTRIRTILHLHERLYFRDHFAEIDLADYLKYVCSETALALDPEHAAELRVDLAEIRVDMDTAAPLGLIVHELIANAYRHGVGASRADRVELSLKGSDDSFVLEVRDNGSGEVPTETPAPIGSGLSLVRALSRQLGATVEIRHDHGPSVAVRVKSPSGA